MSKTQCVLTGMAAIVILLAAGCGSNAPTVQESPVIAQDILLGADDASDIPEMTVMPDSGDTAGQEQALADEKEYLQNEIDRLNEKIKNLQWLRDSYVQENPADLMTKLADCDALIADAHNELTKLQDRLINNEQNLGALSNDTHEGAPEDIQPLTETPSNPPMSASDESVPVS